MHLQSELYNGTGYISHSTNSPYVWAGTTHQEPGKFVADGVWDESAWDSQMGTSAIWKKLCARRPDIAEAFEIDEAEAVAEIPPEEIVENYRFVKVRLSQTIEERRRYLGRAREIPRGVKAAIFEKSTLNMHIIPHLRAALGGSQAGNLRICCRRFQFGTCGI